MTESGGFSDSSLLLMVALLGCKFFHFEWLASLVASSRFLVDTVVGRLSTAGDGIGNLLGLERKLFVDRFFDDGPECLSRNETNELNGSIRGWRICRANALIVSGASLGIGRAVAIVGSVWCRSGHQLSVTSKMLAGVAECEEAGGKAHAVKADFGEEQQIQSLVEQSIHHGRN